MPQANRLPTLEEMIPAAAVETTVRQMWSAIRLYVHPEAREIVQDQIRDALVNAFTDGVRRERQRSTNEYLGLRQPTPT